MSRRMLSGPVDLLGLNAYGNNPGLNPIWGTAIGGGTAGVTMLVARHAGLKHPEAIGFGVGLASAGVMYAMRGTRHAGIGAAIGATLAAGIALLGKMLLGEAVVPTVAATPAPGVGFPQARALNGLGFPQARALNGMGIPAVSNVPHAAGAIPGVAGAQLASPGGGTPPVSLMGTPSAAAIHLMGIGGPPVHGLSAAYGATLLGAGR